MVSTRFITKGKGDDRRVIPIKSRKGMTRSSFNSKPIMSKSRFKVPTLPNDPTRPLPIGNLSSFQRQLAEEEIGSKIEDKGFDDNFFQFENGEEYWIFDNEDDAREKAVEQEKDLLESEPSIAVKVAENFPSENFIFLTETDQRVLANDLADSKTEGITDELREELISDVENEIESEIEENPKKFGLTKEDVEEQSDEWQDVFDKEVDEELERQIDEKADERQEEVFADIKDKLENDPVGFLVDDEGLFSREDLHKQNFIRLDIDKIAEFVIDTDGVAPTLATFDGDEKEVEVNGVKLFMYRAN